MDLQIVEFEDPELNRLAEVKYYDFLDWLNAQRRKAENSVRALYPRLKDGVSVQEIQSVLDDAAHWYGVPDDLAGMYAYDMVVSGKRHTIISASLDIHVCEWWLDCHYQPDAEVELNDHE